MFRPSVRWNYERIKEAAKDQRCKVNALLALAPKNDPFYVGAPASLQQAEWFAEIWQKTTRKYLRGIHYWIVSHGSYTLPDGRPYENTEACWQAMCEASKKARYLGLVPTEELEDKKTPDPVLYAKYYSGDPSFEVYMSSMTNPYVEVGGFNPANLQPYHLEVWIEKSSMNDRLRPLCSTYGANLVSFEGEVSITSVYRAYERIEASGFKPTRIFWISDFDPAGISMPAAMSRKLEFFIQTNGAEVDARVKSIALTAEQVQQYSLPRIPIKETETRGDAFEKAFGVGAAELDALDALRPGVLERLVTSALEPYYDSDKAHEIEETKAELQLAVHREIVTITQKYKDHIEALNKMREEIEQIEIDTDEYAVDPAIPDAVESDDFLFNSLRDYTEQINYYKSHKGLISSL